MKRMMPFAITTATLCLAVSTSAWAGGLLPGQVDFGTFSPPGGDGEFVEVNLPGGLISLAARLVEKDQPDVAQLLNGLKLVHVNVIGLDDDNRAAILERVQKVRKDLTGKGWDRVVTVQEKGKDIGVYLKMAGDGAVQGLAAVVMDGEQHAVFANIVGDIKPEQIAMLGEKLHIDPLSKIGGAVGKPAKKAKHKAAEKESEKAEE